MLGGYQPVAAENLAKVQQIVNANAGAVNSALGLNDASFTVNSAEYQVVAGTNYCVHLTAGDGHKHTVKLYVGLDGNLSNAESVSH